MNVKRKANDSDSLKGFTDWFDLTKAHIAYSELLRRKCVQVNQDNRLCERFGFKHVKGSLYKAHLISANLTPVVKNETNDNSASSVHPEGDTTKQAAEKHDVGQFDIQGAIPKTRPQEAMATVSAQNTSRDKKSDSSHVKQAKDKLMTEEMSKLAEGHEKSAETLGNIARTTRNRLKEQISSMGLHTKASNLVEKLSEQTELALGGKISAEEFFNLQSEIILNLLKTLMVQDRPVAQPGDKNHPTKVKQSVEKLSTERSRPEQKKSKLALKAMLGEQKTKSEPRSNFTSAPNFTSKPNFTSSPSTVSHSETASSAENESEEEPIKIDIDHWDHYVQKEIENGKYARRNREKGMDTIICLDMSSSMKGAPWEQAKNFIKNFIEGIQCFDLHESVFEHVALVTFGSETRVQQHSTCDYFEVLRKLDHLKPGGPSPLHAGLLMCRAALMGGAGLPCFGCNGYKMYPRMFIITDGRATDSRYITGPDVYTKLDDFQEALIMQEIEVIKTFNVKVNVVPVEGSELSILEKIAENSDGKMVNCSDWQLQSRAFKNYITASQLDKRLVRDNTESVLPFLHMILPHKSSADMEQVAEFLSSNAAEDDDYREQPGLPPLGSRLQRSIPGDDQYRLGTITKHMDRGSVGITWDEGSPLREGIKYSTFDHVNIKVINEPRVLKDQLIDVGCRVRRGPDWRYPDQDGGAGNMGNVFKVEPSGSVWVRWDNTSPNVYRFGADGAFDVEIVDTPQTSSGEVKGKAAVSLSEEDLEKQHILDMNARNMAAGSAKNESHKPLELPTASKPRKNKNLMGEMREHSTSPATDISASAPVAIKDLSKKIGTRLESDEGKNQRQNDKNEASIKGAMSDASSSVAQYQWAWQDGQNWRPYPADVSQIIESNYVKHPTGTCLISIQDQQYRIVYPQMKQVNIRTRGKVPIIRIMNS